MPEETGAPDAPASTTGRRPARRGSRRWLVAALLVAGLATAWLVLSGGRGDEPAPAPAADAPASPGLDEPTPNSDSIGQIGADAISGAEDLVDALNSRDDETELLAELGLDPLGEPLADAATTLDAAGHTFRWTDRAGSTATITVVAATGDHSLRTDDGIEFRSIGGTAFARTAGSDEWAEITGEAIASIDRLGLAGPLTTGDLLGDAAPYATERAGGATIDDAAFVAADPAAREAWLDLIGLSATLDGPLTATYELLSDGATISSATLERPATGERVSYQLAELHQQPPVIELLD